MFLNCSSQAVLRIFYGLAVICLLSACGLQPKKEHSVNAGQAWQERGSALLLKQRSALQARNAEQTEDFLPSYLQDLLDSQNLLSLVKQGLSDNPSLHQQRLAVARSELSWRDDRAGILPALTATLGQSRGELQEQSYSTALNLSLPIDVWGKQLARVDAAKATWAAQLANLRHQENSLASNIVSQYVDLQQSHTLQALYQERQRLLEQNRSSIVDQYRRGLGSLDDLETAKISAANANISLAAEKQRLFENQSRLATTLGLVDLELELDTGLIEVKEAVSEQLLPMLTERQDLKAAYAQILAAQANTKVAYREMFPSFNIGLGLQQNSLQLEDSLLKSPVWTMLSQLSAPIFNGGTLRRRAKSAAMSAEESYWNFQQLLLAAVVEIESKYRQEISLQLQEEQIAIAVISAQRDVQNYRDRYQQGLVDYLELTTVQDRLLSQKIEQIRIGAQRQTNRIELALALGLGVHHEHE